MLPTLVAMGALLYILNGITGKASTAKAVPIQSIPDYSVQFDIANPSTGINSSFTIDIYSGWAELGASQFKKIITEGAWKGARFFRVVPGFVVQWGIPGDPLIAQEWRGRVIKDDPATIKKNVRGTISFAASGPNSRTSQVFINFGNNIQLDMEGFSPFGKVAGKGMEVVDAIYSAHGQSPDQGKIQSEGNKYLEAAFPNLSYIIDARIIWAVDMELKAGKDL